MTKSIELKNLSHSFDPKGMWALKNVNLHLDAHKTTVLLGPSGIGKSTLLKIMSGEIEPDAGEVVYQGRPLAEQRHRFAFIPQEWDVSTEQTVYLYLCQKAQQLTQLSEGERHQHVRSFIELFHLQGQAQKPVNVLSTGQKARVVLASYLLHRPEIVMMDEPFAHLDRSLRRQLEDELKEILDSWQAGLILVTHNLEEAFEKAQDALLMIEGKLLKGNLVSFYHRPPSAEAARFLGDVNLLASKILKRSAECLVVKNSLGVFELKNFCRDLMDTKYSHAHLMIRPELVEIQGRADNQGVASGQLRGEATVGKVFSRGSVELVHLIHQQNILLKSLVLSHPKGHQEGQEVSYLIDFNDLYALKI